LARWGLENRRAAGEADAARPGAETIAGRRHQAHPIAIIRNTTPDLKRSTIKSWIERFPPEIYGPVKIGAPMHHDIKFGDVEMEVDFIGLDKDEDIRKLRSTQYTRSPLMNWNSLRKVCLMRRGSGFATLRRCTAAHLPRGRRGHKCPS
jgi:hypothetical protein